MQSPVAVSTLRQLKDGHGQDTIRYGLAALMALGALGAAWSAIAGNF